MGKCHFMHFSGSKRSRSPKTSQSLQACQNVAVESEFFCWQSFHVRNCLLDIVFFMFWFSSLVCELFDGICLIQITGRKQASFQTQNFKPSWWGEPLSSMALHLIWTAVATACLWNGHQNYQNHGSLHEVLSWSNMCHVCNCSIATGSRPAVPEDCCRMLPPTRLQLFLSQ